MHGGCATCTRRVPYMCEFEQLELAHNIKDDFQDAFTRAKYEQLCADPFKEAAAPRGNNMWRLRAIGGGSGEGRTFPPTRRGKVVVTF